MHDTPTPLEDLEQLLRTMRPVHRPGVYVFACVADALHIPASQVMASIQESEGLSVVVSEEYAVEAGLAFDYRAAWITLTVHSSLSAVGLTAVVARALADQGISCNVVAGMHHDHLFVPHELGEKTLTVLETFSRG